MVIDALARLEATTEITRLKARYVRALEERDWDLYADCLAKDVEARFSPPPGKTEATFRRGRSALRAWIPEALASVHVVMRVSSPDIEVETPDRARGTWAMVERLEYPGDGPERGRIYYGHYHETYVRDADGAWRIKTVAIERARADSIARDGTVTVELDWR